MGRTALPWGIAALLSAWLGGACGGSSALEAQRARLSGEHAERMVQLDRIESRLLSAQARQREWQELQQRHERVSAIACENVGEHVAAMIRHEERQQEKWRKKRTPAHQEVHEQGNPEAEKLSAFEPSVGIDGG